MAGALTISTLNNDTGVLATQNGMTGIAKAWANFQGGNGNTGGTINNSFNVSSVTVNGTGDYTVNFTTAMPNINYAGVAGGLWTSTPSSNYGFQIAVNNTSTSACRITHIFNQASFYNAFQITVSVFA